MLVQFRVNHDSLEHKAKQILNPTFGHDIAFIQSFLRFHLLEIATEMLSKTLRLEE